MKVYSYDYNGKYIGEADAELCQVTELKKSLQKEGEEPIESVLLIPAYSTEIAPPEVKENEFAVFNDGKWEVKEHQITEEQKPIEEKKEEPKELSYAEKRVLEYPPTIEYIDGIIKGDKKQVEKYINDCLAVKAKYPKV